MTTQYERFHEVTDEIYDGCTTEQKLGVYIQHHPAAIVPFLLELILELHPEKDSLFDSDILKKAAYEKRHHPDQNA